MGIFWSFVAMNSLNLSFSVVFPLFCMLTLGYFLRAIQLFNDDFLKQCNNLCFKVFLPLVLFINIINSNFQQDFSIKLILSAVLCIGISFTLLMIIIPRVDKNNNNRGVMIQGIFRSNFILFGIPMVATLYGQESTSTTAILLAFVIPLFNLLSIIALEIYSKEKSSVSSIIKSALLNPLIIASAVAFFFILADIKLPILVESTISDISKIATPFALIILGGSFQFKSLHKYKRSLILSVIAKLIIMPLCFIPFLVYVGFRNIELASLLGMLASPTAVSTFTMAQSARANEELAGQIVVIDSILSIITIFIWISVLTTLNFL